MKQLRPSFFPRYALCKPSAMLAVGKKMGVYRSPGTVQRPNKKRTVFRADLCVIEALK